MAPIGKWRGVPVSFVAAWQDAFQTASAGHSVDAACPVCGKPGLHRYYSEGPLLQSSMPGFVSRGGLWEWCSFCRTFEHSSVLVPDWWKSDLDVDESRLTVEPEALQRAVEQTT